ncbi:MAG: hypothetical protein QOE86_1423 [Solirubrobacteraceae bacterium]|nr:hypothetical protein [Solirubrobacteraceae bacterium]
MSASTSLRELAARLREADGLLSAATHDPAPDADTTLGDTAAAGDPRYALLVEAIREGYLAHYGEGRVLRSDDKDLELLAGDHLYALGLDRLAELGDLDSVKILAGVIARCAQAHAEDRPADATEAWRQGAAAVAARRPPASGSGPNT